MRDASFENAVAQDENMRDADYKMRKKCELENRRSEVENV